MSDDLPRAKDFLAPFWKALAEKVRHGEASAFSGLEVVAVEIALDWLLEHGVVVYAPNTKHAD